MKQTELKATVFVKLRKLGFKVEMNKRVRVSDFRGYKALNMDIVILDKDWPVLGLMVGPIKQRKLMKYSMSKIPFLTIEDEEDLEDKLKDIYKRYANSLFPTK